MGQIIFTLRFPSRSKIYQGWMKKVWKELDLDIGHDWGFNAKEASAGRKSACEKWELDQNGSTLTFSKTIMNYQGIWTETRNILLFMAKSFLQQKSHRKHFIVKSSNA